MWDSRLLHSPATCRSSGEHSHVFWAWMMPSPHGYAFLMVRCEEDQPGQGRTVPSWLDELAAHVPVTETRLPGDWLRVPVREWVHCDVTMTLPEAGEVRVPSY